MPDTSVLHLICGKIAAGKSTLAARLAGAPRTILISEDFWLSRLYKDEQKTLEDYVRNSRRLREAMGPHIAALLRAGVSVVLDYPANTVPTRQWMLGVAEAAKADHRLHFLDVSDEECKARLRRRNQEGKHDFAATDAEFDQFTSYFVAPTANEGLNIVVHDRC